MTSVRSRRGGAAVEFALFLPVLMLLLAGVIEWGWYLSREVAVVQAVREGAMTGSLTREADDPVAQGTARTLAALAEVGFDADAATCTGALADTASGRTVTLRAHLPYDNLVPLVPTPSVVGAELTTLLVDQ